MLWLRTTAQPTVRLILSARMGEALLTSHVGALAPDSPPGRIEPEAYRAARRTIRGQIARLEAELGDAVVESFAMRGHGEGAAPRPSARSAPAHPLDLGELELVRDELADRLHVARAANAARAAAQREKRAELERMLAEPGRHRFTAISCEELGEPGCGVWQVRPRLGLIGMLAGWWQVKLSSGCPLPGRS
jgi:hypothetical protein